MEYKAIIRHNSVTMPTLNQNLIVNTCLYSGFLQRARILSTKLLTQGSLENRYILSVKMFSWEISTPYWKASCQLRCKYSLDGKQGHHKT
jgi:hypothetical protein